MIPALSYPSTASLIVSYFASALSVSTLLRHLHFNGPYPLKPLHLGCSPLRLCQCHVLSSRPRLGQINILHNRSTVVMISHDCALEVTPDLFADIDFAPELRILAVRDTKRTQSRKLKRACMILTSHFRGWTCCPRIYPGCQAHYFSNRRSMSSASPAVGDWSDLASDTSSLLS